MLHVLTTHTKKTTEVNKGQVGAFGGDGFVCCLDCYDGLVHISKVIKLYILNMYTV